MGAVNYKTSDFITIGLEPFDFEDFENEAGETDFNQRSFEMQCDFDNIASILAKYNFHFIHVKLEPGYYEGFTVDLENNFDVCFDSYEDKRNALKEVTQLKNFLLECIDNGLCEVSPGWCTGYSSREKSIQGVKNAMQELKEHIKKDIPTWYYCKLHQIEI